MELIYPWFQEHNTEDSGVIGICFITQTVKEMKLVCGNGIKEEDLETEADTKWRKELMALELVVLILS